MLIIEYYKYFTIYPKDDVNIYLKATARQQSYIRKRNKTRNVDIATPIPN